MRVIFCVFYSNFNLHDSLENAVSEHLQWLKFQNFPGLCFQTPHGSLQCPPDPPAVSHTAYGRA